MCITQLDVPFAPAHCLCTTLPSIGCTGVSRVVWRRVHQVTLFLCLQVGMGIACDLHDLQRDYSSAAEFQPAGILDLHLLAHACRVYKPLSPAALANEQAKRAKGIKTFNRREQWGLAGAHYYWLCAGLRDCSKSGQCSCPGQSSTDYPCGVSEEMQASILWRRVIKSGVAGCLTCMLSPK